MDIEFEVKGYKNKFRMDRDQLVRLHMLSMGMTLNTNKILSQFKDSFLAAMKEFNEYRFGQYSDLRVSLGESVRFNGQYRFALMYKSLEIQNLGFVEEIK